MGVTAIGMWGYPPVRIAGGTCVLYSFLFILLTCIERFSRLSVLPCVFTALFYELFAN